MGGREGTIQFPITGKAARDTAAAATTPQAPEKESGLSTAHKAIIGGVIGALVVAGGTVGAYYYIRAKKEELTKDIEIIRASSLTDEEKEALIAERSSFANTYLPTFMNKELRTLIDALRTEQELFEVIEEVQEEE